MNTRQRAPERVRVRVCEGERAKERSRGRGQEGLALSRAVGFFYACRVMAR
jgi:hypothetical protein